MTLNWRRVALNEQRAERVATSSCPVRYAQIYPIAGNTGAVYVGGPAVFAVSGYENGAPLNDSDNFRVENADLHEVWFAVATANDGIVITAELA